MELSHFVRAIVRHWVVASVVLVLCLVGAGYLAYSPADRYQATTTLLVEPSDVSTVGDVAAVTFLIPALQVQLGTASVHELAAGYVEAGLRDQAVGVSSSVDSGTGILRVTTGGDDRAAVGPWADAYARALVASQPSDSPLSIRTIDPASTPSAPSGPARTSTMVSGAVLGVILAVLAALIAHALAQRRRLPQEVRRRFGVPVLGELPRIRRKSRGLSAPELLGGADDGLVEPVIRLRAAVEAQLVSRQLASVSVTSYEFGEGKTVVLAALAWALAGAGHPVGIVEADLRRPALEERVANPGVQTEETELGVAIAGAATGPQVRFVSSDDLLALARTDVLPRHGAMHPADAVTLALPQALRDLERPGALVLVDTPPLRHAAEAAVAARLTSGVLLVVDASARGFFDRVETALARLDEAGALVVGVVLTRTGRGRSGGGGVGQALAGPLGRTAGATRMRSKHATPLG